jgi:hypothetical protein
LVACQPVALKARLKISSANRVNGDPNAGAHGLSITHRTGFDAPGRPATMWTALAIGGWLDRVTVIAGSPAPNGRQLRLASLAKADDIAA